MKLDQKTRWGYVGIINMKGEKIMAKPIMDVFPGSDIIEKHNWQRGIDKKELYISP